MRARLPDRDGYAERDGVQLFYEVFGDREPTLVLLPTWSIIHSRHWKAQVPYLSRHFRVVTFDGRGNGRSDRPLGGEAYTMPQFAEDAVAVMDAVGVGRAVIVSLSLGASIALILASTHPERVAAMAFVAPTTPFGPSIDRPRHGFDEALDTDERWAKYNRHYWRRDYRGFVDFFWSQAFTEPHSTKQIEDCVGWAMEIGPETLILTAEGEDHRDSLNPPAACGRPLVELCADVRCPVLVIGGDEDAIAGHGKAIDLAERTGGTLVTLSGSGHLPHARDPVQVNLLLRQFAESIDPPAPSGRRWVRGRSRGEASEDLALAHRSHPSPAGRLLVRRGTESLSRSRVSPPPASGSCSSGAIRSSSSTKVIRSQR